MTQIERTDCIFQGNSSAKICAAFGMQHCRYTSYETITLFLGFAHVCVCVCVRLSRCVQIAVGVGISISTAEQAASYPVDNIAWACAR